MAGVLVHVHHDDGQFSANSLGVLAKAAGLGGEVTAFVAGSGIDDGWAATLGGHGAARVLVADDPALLGGLSQPIVDAIEPHARAADSILFGAGVVSADVAAGLAARLGAGIACETTELAGGDGGIVATRPALGDTVMVESGFAAAPGVVLARANAFAPREEPSGDSAPVERVEVSVSDWARAAVLSGREAAETGGVDITEADILVTVGRGLGGPENVHLVEELAKALGGEVAATRAVVDAGWVPYSMQVGQTGKTVSPKLYIACGVSGAIQHKVGMANAGTIIAINKDQNAPIFEFADVGVVGDALAILPKLTELVAARRG
jgi:electron transfer flavoprotein alpha subunit